jgi:hypothetical protein
MTDRIHGGRVLAALLLAASLACRERGTPDPAIRLAISHEKEEAPATAPAPDAADGSASPSSTGSESGKVPIPTQLVVPPMVGQMYSGIRVAWKDSSNGKSGTLEVPLGGSAPIPDSTLAVSTDVFLPAFTMSAQTISTNSLAEENPAARISVKDKGQEIFAGWIFNRFPDVHPFQHPRFSLKLEGGVRRASAG